MLTDHARSLFERDLATAFLGAMLAPELLRLLGTPPDVANVPAAYWAALDVRLLAALEPIITDMARASAAGLGASQGIVSAVDWTMVNQRAASWASRYTFDLVQGIDATSQARLQQLVTAYFKTSGQDLHQLGAQIGEMFGPARAQLIATTETTRAAAQGEQRLLDTIRAANPRVKVIDIFLTSRDERVCPLICGPLNGVRGDGHGNFVNPLDGQVYGIPGHPGCRCGQGTIIEGLPNPGGL